MPATLRSLPRIAGMMFRRGGSVKRRADLGVGEGREVLLGGEGMVGAAVSKAGVARPPECRSGGLRYAFRLS